MVGCVGGGAGWSGVELRVRSNAAAVDRHAHPQATTRESVGSRNTINPHKNVNGLTEEGEEGEEGEAGRETHSRVSSAQWRGPSHR
jgi:hypothetical protein